MPRKAKGLSALALKVTQPGRYCDGNGLYLLVRGPDAKFWVFRYTRNGRMREMGLGRAGRDRGAVTLAEAREKAADLRAQLRKNIDPLDQRAADKAAARASKQDQAVRSRTFRYAADHYIESHEAGWRNLKHAKQWRSTLATYAHAHIGEIPVADIGTSHVLAVLEPIWKLRPETAVRLRGRIEKILDHAKARGWRTGENPALWRGHLSETLPARSRIAPVKHHAALPWRETGAFVDALRRQSGSAARGLEFAILTAARSGEVRGATWAEINLSEKTWTIPGARMKAGKEHRVPLSQAAVELLVQLQSRENERQPDECIFVGRRGQSLSDMALAMVLRRMQRLDLTVHGFRSTFRDWVSESTGYAREVAEAALAHTLDDKVEAAYRRGDLFEKRRRLMEEWAAYCERTASGSDVVGSPRVASAGGTQ